MKNLKIINLVLFLLISMFKIFDKNFNIFLSKYLGINFYTEAMLLYLFLMLLFFQICNNSKTFKIMLIFITIINMVFTLKILFNFLIT